MKVECEICGIMCFDNCKDELKEMEEHRQNSSYHKNLVKQIFQDREIVEKLKHELFRNIRGISKFGDSPLKELVELKMGGAYNEKQKCIGRITLLQKILEKKKWWCSLLTTLSASLYE